MNVDPSFLKLWYAWVKWMNHIQYWDPYGAAITLVLVGFVLGFFMWKLFND